MRKIQETPNLEWPREKLARLGAKALSDAELIAILLGSGTKTVDVMTLARKLVETLDCLNDKVSIDPLMKISGIGRAKSTLVVAALEFARRRIVSDGVRVKEPQDIIPLISHLADRKQETFICISLNGAHEVIASRIVTLGLANVCQVHPREVFADPLCDRACAVIVAHNHPSGDLTPSKEDLKVTERLKEAAQILGIRFLDHIIFSRRGYYSIDQENIGLLAEK